MEARKRRASFEYEDLIACGRGELFGTGNPQLPLPPLLMFDRIAEISEEGGANGKGAGVAEVKFSDQVLPTVKRIIYGVDLKRVFKGKLVLGIADGWLEADGARIYEAKDLRVGLFKGAEPAPA